MKNMPTFPSSDSVMIAGNLGSKPPAAMGIIGRAFIYLSAAAIAIVVVVIYDAMSNPSRTPWGVSSFESDRYQYQANQETAFEPIPGFTGVSDLSEPKTHITYDRWGGRVDGPDSETANPVYLMTVGCSQAWGQGVTNSQTFTSVLGTKLGKTVGNFGVSGYGGVGSLLRLRQRIHLTPKVILYAFWEDHLNRNVDRCPATGSPVCLEMPTVQFDAENHPHIRLPSNPARDLAQMRKWYLEASGQTDKYRTFMTEFYWAGYSVWRSFETESRRRLGLIEAPSIDKKIAAANFVIDHMKTTADAVGALLVVVYIPDYLGTVIKEAPQDVRVKLEQKGGQFIDMTERLQAMRQAGVILAIPGDGHITDVVHQAVADEVAKRL